VPAAAEVVLSASLPLELSLVEATNQAAVPAALEAVDNLPVQVALEVVETLPAQAALAATEVTVDLPVLAVALVVLEAMEGLPKHRSWNHQDLP
jgi:hypothetical protein